MRMLNNIFGVFFLTVLLLVSCTRDNTHPGYEYMPDMYRTPSYKTYEQNNLFADSTSARIPVKGSIARGHMPYKYSNTNEGYEEAKVYLTNPNDFSDSLTYIEEGKELYKMFCASCHGEKGDGQGQLVLNEKILGVPSYNDPGRIITEGSIYHVIMYGKGIMGSHASQLTEDERWKIVSYVQQLKMELENN